MKTLFLKLALIVAATAAAFGVSAQQSFGVQWGATPEEQRENAIKYNFYKDAYTAKDYDQAAGYLPDLLQNAPKGHENIYIYGINLYKNKITQATTVADKNIYVDSLMMLYDLRAENFGDQAERGRPYILSRKAEDYLNYKPADREGVAKYFREAIEASGNDADLDFINIYFNELTEDYREDLVEADEYLDEYEKLQTIVNLPSNNDKTAQRTTFDALFLRSGAANCENLEKIFRARVEANPTDAELLEKVASQLQRAKCQGDFFFEVAEKFHAVAPSTKTAIILSRGYGEKNDFAKSLQYLNEAYNIETDPASKESLGIEIAFSQIGAGNGKAGADAARQVISLNPENGYAYYALGEAYALGSSQCSDFARQTTFWLIYDTLANARRLISDDAETVSRIDSRMGSFRGSFPTHEETFFHGLENGQSYTVRCGWVTGTTTVRTR